MNEAPNDPQHGGAQPEGFNPRDFFTPRIPSTVPAASFTTEDPGDPAFLRTYLAPQPIRRIPHLGHAALFILMTFCLLLLTVAALVLSHHPHGTQQAAALAQQPRIAILSELITYLLALVLSALIFPLMWHRSFPSGIQWNFSTARRLATRLIPFGIVLSFAVEAVNSRLPQPRDMPIDHFFRTSSDVWLITAFGTLLAPAFEEICFRGFLLPAVAIAWDWIALKRDPASIAQWDSTTSLSKPALIFSAITTSLLFIWLHSAQLAGSHSALATLFAVSLVFTYMRVRYRSVAVSALLHASYNFTVFLMLFAATGGYRHLDRLTR